MTFWGMANISAQSFSGKIISDPNPAIGLGKWTGLKIHADVNDSVFPVSMVMTSASVHDSQVATPMMMMTSSKVDYLYDLMDSAHDAQLIYEVSRGWAYPFD
jgi:hypothetical protein